MQLYGHLIDAPLHCYIQRPHLDVAGGFPVAIMHGHEDLVAMTRYAAKIADRLGVPLLLVHGGHFIPRECATEVRAADEREIQGLD